LDHDLEGRRVQSSPTRRTALPQLAKGIDFSNRLQDYRTNSTQADIIRCQVKYTTKYKTQHINYFVTTTTIGHEAPINQRCMMSPSWQTIAVQIEPKDIPIIACE
jgi:hypothetical protein